MIERIKDIMLTFEGIICYLFFLRFSCYLPERWLRRYQYRKLKKLLLVCESKIPYYKRLFKEVGFDVEKDFNSLSDIKRIPITTKENVRKHWIEFINPELENNAIELKTSGSTGEPLSVLVSANQWIVEQGIVWRHWVWNGYHFRDRMAIVRSYTPPKGGRLIKYDRIRNFIYYSPYHLTDDNIDRYLNHMIKEHIRFLRGYPSSLEALAQYVLRTGHAIPKIKGIFSASEVLTDDVRRNIEKAFAVPVTNWYGLAECIITMGDCAQHHGLHVFEEYGYTEFLDTKDANRKKVIGTNLHNYAMPLLRYETNDVAIVDGRELRYGNGCKKNSRVVKNIIGRSNSVIMLKDRDVPLTNFYTYMEHFPEVESWQIVQLAKGKIELVLGKAISSKLREELTEGYRIRLPEDVEFSIREDGEFSKKGEGKKLAFVRVDG